MPYKDPEVRRLKQREISRRWEKNNPEKVIARRSTPEYKAWMKKYTADHYQKNKAKKRAQGRLYYQTTLKAKRQAKGYSPEKAAYMKKYAATPSGAAILKRGWKLRKIRKRGSKVLLSEVELKQVRLLVAHAIKLGPNYHVEHVLPLCRGGTGHPSNLTIVSAGVNKMKGSRTLEELCQAERARYDADVLKFDPRLG